MNNKAYLQIPFAWLFSIIVGIFILSLAIYGVIKVIHTGEETIDAKTGKEIGILLNPLEMSFQSAQSSPLVLPVETRIYNKCNNKYEFGRQIIQISQKSFNKWTETDVDVGFSNKYIFSENPCEGKKFYVFSKPFEFPFKVADLIYLTSSSQKYCFVDAPENIEREISTLNQENFLTENCSESSIKICFDNSNCDVNVNYNKGTSDSYSYGFVKKRGESVNFKSDALMYAGIFADKEIYECQVKRLMQRIEKLSLIYYDKSKFVSQKGCHSNLNLLGLNNAAGNSGGNLDSVIDIVEDIKEKNNMNWECKLW